MGLFTKHRHVGRIDHYKKETDWGAVGFAIFLAILLIAAVSG